MSPPEYLNGDVPNLFSNIKYDVVTRKRTPSLSSSPSSTFREINDDVEVVVTARQSTNNGVLSSSVLLCGTSLGCGLLFLPHAMYPSGYLPGIAASIVAWAYMTMTALLTSELLINRYGETGKARNVGILELYASHLGVVGGRVAGIGFVVVSYLVVGVYLAEGGDRLSMLLAYAASTIETATTMVGGGGGAVSPSLLGRALFVAGTGALLSLASRYNAVQYVITNFLVPTTLVAFAIAMWLGSPTTDLSSLFASTNQHPEVVFNAFPLLFMGWTYHGVVPRVVYDLEGDKDKITRAIVLGEYATCAFVPFLAGMRGWR
jgi:tyrosine-specific transport protein